MKFSESEERIIASAIEHMDDIQPEFDKCSDNYDHAKIFCGFGLLLTGFLTIDIFLGSREIFLSFVNFLEDVMPLLFIGIALLLWEIRKRYENTLHRHYEYDRRFHELGLIYTPVGKSSKERRLRHVDTKTDLNPDVFSWDKVQRKTWDNYLKDHTSES